MAGPLLPSLLSLAVLAAAADAFSTAPLRCGPARVGPSSALSSLVNDGVFQTSPPLRIEVRESKRGGPTADPSL